MTADEGREGRENEEGARKKANTVHIESFIDHVVPCKNKNVQYERDTRAKQAACAWKAVKDSVLQDVDVQTDAP